MENSKWQSCKQIDEQQRARIKELETENKQLLEAIEHLNKIAYNIMDDDLQDQILKITNGST